MATFREARNQLLDAFSNNLINDEEFLLLYDLNTSKNVDLPYYSYDYFDLDKLCDDECKVEFRFQKNDIYQLAEAFDIPEFMRCYNGIKICGIEALCIYLKRFAYPCRYSDIMPRFGRDIPQLSMISNLVMNYIYQNHKHRLENFNQIWLSPHNLQLFANFIHSKGAPLDNCWGFIDGTVRPVCRSQQMQRVIYNGHKRVHAIKFQSVVAPNGMIVNLFGPVEGRKHDSGMLACSGLLTKLQQHSYAPNGNPLCIYGDPAYPLRAHLQGPFPGPNVAQKAYNKSMSQCRVAVEWVFSDIINFFAFLDFKKDLKIGLSAVGKMYVCCALIRNARNCLYKSTTSNFFELEPPSLMDYFQ